MTRILCFCIVLLAALPVHARMYQWVNPHTGRTQMSGKPPAWYRSDQPGPRVYVFEKGRLVDDTAKTVSEEERAALRATAFAASRLDTREGGSATEGSESPGETALPGEEGTSAEGEALLGRGFGEKETSQPQGTNEPPDATIARLKSIIDAWETQQTEEAKRLLERSALVPPATSPESRGDQSKASANTAAPAPTP